MVTTQSNSLVSQERSVKKLVVIAFGAACSHVPPLRSDDTNDADLVRGPPHVRRWAMWAEMTGTCQTADKRVGADGSQCADVHRRARPVVS